MKRKCLMIFMITVFSIFLTGCKESVIPEDSRALEGLIITQPVTTAEEKETTQISNTTTVRVETTCEVTTTKPVTTTTEVTTTTTTATTITTTTTTTTDTMTTITTGTEITSPIESVPVAITSSVGIQPAVKPNESAIKDLPITLMNYVNSQKQAYPGLSIGCGVFSLDGTNGFGYNMDEEIYSACTIKLPYAMYVLKTCQDQNVNLWSTKLTYQSWMKNDGSGYIKNAPVGTEYSIGYLINPLLKVSDNTAYNILRSKFDLAGYQAYLNTIGGQNLYGSAYGRASVRQRKNEWVEAIKFINTQTPYAQVLQQNCTGKRTWNPNTGRMEIDPDGSQYCYLVEWMKHEHEFMHKSGWSWGDYMSACDCAVIDNQYLIIILTADYETGLSRTDILRGFGYAVEEYVDSVGGVQNLFS